MKKLFLFFCCILFSQLFSQTTYVFNVELNDKNNAPTFTNNNGVFVYNGTNQPESTFFSNYTITNFYPTYPNYSGYLVNVFTFITTSSTLMNDLKTQFPSKYLKTEDLTGLNLQLVSYPNDYGTTSPVTNLGSSMSLKSFDYINAPKAWDFFPNFKGNVTIGISDGMVNNTDLDFANNVSYLQQNLFNSNYVCPINQFNDPGFAARHGTSIAAIAAAKGNNAHGIAGVCYDCKILNIPYTVDGYNPNFSGLMQLAQQGVRVINMSWIQGFNNNDPTYMQGYYQTQQDAINQLHNMGVVLVAGAGNQSSWDTFTAPYHVVYSYPASYDNVISVTVVHAKNSNLLDEVTGPIPTWGYVSNYNEDVLCVNGGLGFDLANPVFAPFYNQSTTTNSRVDICGPAYGPLYPNYILGCQGLYGNTTSIATPFVTGTVALIQSLNSCILPSEVEDVLQLTSKNLEIKPENVNFIGRSGSGKLETGDAVEFTHEMMNSTGNAIIDGQDFWRFNFDLQHINNKLTISNQTFRDSNTSNFIAKNSIEVLQNSDFRPNSNGFVDLKIDGGLTVCSASSKAVGNTNSQENDALVINKAVLFPNPNKGTFSIKLSQKEIKDLQVIVFDILGKTVYQTKVDQSEFELNVPNLPSGIFLVKLTSNTINETLKFVKE
ncbi:S8 family serine peptidase [Flavobacterium sp. j3]|uniref:S8 family serine peptidase n=1 Tax=Flavobacterium aureirubrum TaxID=3133147 RepID=A0ABU9N515_9FLAO